MNVVFYLILVIVLVLLWFSISHVFKDIGEYIMTLFDDAVQALTSDSDDTEENYDD